MHVNASAKLSHYRLSRVLPLAAPKPFLTPVTGRNQRHSRSGDTFLRYRIKLGRAEERMSGRFFFRDDPAIFGGKKPGHLVYRADVEEIRLPSNRPILASDLDGVYCEGGVGSFFGHFLDEMDLLGNYIYKALLLPTFNSGNFAVYHTLGPRMLSGMSEDDIKGHVRDFCINIMGHEDFNSEVPIAKNKGSAPTPLAKRPFISKAGIEDLWTRRQGNWFNLLFTGSLVYVAEYMFSPEFIVPYAKKYHAIDLPADVRLFDGILGSRPLFKNGKATGKWEIPTTIGIAKDLCLQRIIELSEKAGVSIDPTQIEISSDDPDADLYFLLGNGSPHTRFVTNPNEKALRIAHLFGFKTRRFDDLQTTPPNDDYLHTLTAFRKLVLKGLVAQVKESRKSTKAAPPNPPAPAG